MGAVSWLAVPLLLTTVVLAGIFFLWAIAEAAEG